MSIFYSEAFNHYFCVFLKVGPGLLAGNSQHATVCVSPYFLSLLNSVTFYSDCILKHRNGVNLICEDSH